MCLSVSLSVCLSVCLFRAGRPRDKVVWNCPVLKWQGGLPFPWTWRLRGSPPVCFSSCCLFFFLTGLLEEEWWYAERVATRSRYGTWCCVWITSYINMHRVSLRLPLYDCADDNCVKRASGSCWVLPSVPIPGDGVRGGTPKSGQRPPCARKGAGLAPSEWSSRQESVSPEAVPLERAVNCPGSRQRLRGGKR